MNTATLERPKREPQTKRKRIPKQLIYEMVDGKPIYYREYKKVLTKKKSAEEVMGSSALQAQLVALIVGLLVSRLNLQKYVIMTNELGIIYTPKNWRILDVAIFDREKVKNELLSTKYVKTAPKTVIEVDTKADVTGYGNFFSYVTEKTEHLLDAGVEKVIWILTENKKVLVAEQGKQWIIAKWNDTISVIDDISIILEQLMNTLVSGRE